MKFHALEGAVAGGACGLALVALGAPVLWPIALIAGLVAGIRKDNEEVRQAHRRTRREHEDSDSDNDETITNQLRYRNLNSPPTTFNFERYISNDPETTFSIRQNADRPLHRIHQRPGITQDFDLHDYRARDEDDDIQEPFHAINNHHQERRQTHTHSRANEPSLRNEDYFRRHPERA